MLAKLIDTPRSGLYELDRPLPINFCTGSDKAHNILRDQMYLYQMHLYLYLNIYTLGL